MNTPTKVTHLKSDKFSQQMTAAKMRIKACYPKSALPDCPLSRSSPDMDIGKLISLARIESTIAAKVTKWHS